MELTFRYSSTRLEDTMLKAKAGVRNEKRHRRAQACAISHRVDVFCSVAANDAIIRKGSGNTRHYHMAVN